MLHGARYRSLSATSAIVEDRNGDSRLSIDLERCEGTENAMQEDVPEGGERGRTPPNPPGETDRS